MVRVGTPRTLHNRSHRRIFFEIGGGCTRNPRSGEVFPAAVDSSAEWVSSHMNVSETIALYEVLRLLLEARPDFLRAIAITIDVERQ